jgi:hypothetical protein
MHSVLITVSWAFHSHDDGPLLVFLYWILLLSVAMWFTGMHCICYSNVEHSWECVDLRLYCSCFVSQEFDVAFLLKGLILAIFSVQFLCFVCYWVDFCSDTAYSLSYITELPM